ncbi:MAG: radical SAM family heme chaperone HemW [bacterium]|nr:radical SAM family heme chaperone HemW [bacterium]
MTPFALYVHVPWCRHVCPYCDFNVHAAARAPETADVPAYVAELAAWAGDARLRGRTVASVFFGGGTPSLLSPAAIATVLGAVASRFGLAPDAEVTLEANPATVDVERLSGWRRAGVSRLSLGAQSFSRALLRTLGRDHAPDDTHAAVAAARTAGFVNVSLDLIYAVPGATLADWSADLDAALALGPEHVSCYALTWEERTPFATWRERGRLTPVDEDVEAAMAERADARLTAAGYARYEISSWARRGHASAHNQRYWDGSDYLGIGPGAHSFCATPAPGRRWSNHRPPDAWRTAVLAGGTAIADDETLTPAQARADFVVTGLRRLAGLDLGEFQRRFGTELACVFPHVTALERDDLVRRDAERLRLTPRGLRFADTVAATFV